MGIAVRPGGDFVDESLFIGNTAVEALGGENAEFGFREVDPTAECFGCRTTIPGSRHGALASIAGDAASS